MRAAVIDSPGSISVREVPFAPLPGECTIRVLRAGICGTDLQLLEGYAGFTGIPGHEFVGVVDSVASPGDAKWLGRRVVGEINVGCGDCRRCREGVKEHCDRRAVVGIRGRPGAFAEYLSLPPANLHPVPESIDDDAAVFVEPVAAACRILEQVSIPPGTRVAVLGDGRMGLIVGQVLGTATKDVTVIGRHETKLDLARAFGLTAARANDIDGQFDVVVDVTGRADGLRQAVALTRPRGTVVMKTTAHDAEVFESWPVVVHEISLVGSRCGPFKAAIDAIASGSVQVRSLVTRVAKLEEAVQAFDDARTSLKILLAPRTV